MTSELERRLAALGATLELPPAADVVPAVLARLPARRRRRRAARRTVAVAFAATLLLAGAAMAVPPTRHAVLRILGLRGVTIERLPQLPALPATARVGLGVAIPLNRARHAADFVALLPPGSSAAYLAHDLPGGRISLRTGRLLIIEFRGTAGLYLFKIIGPATRVKPLRINGGAGVYVSGAPHEVFFQTRTGQVRTDRVRLAGNVLVWQQGPLIIRIEGARTLGQARALARSLR
jgi:hypothetical protein